MFAKIRNRLTLRYAMVMMLLMMAVIITSSGGLLWILYQEERQDLRSFTEEEAREQAGMYKEKTGFFQLSPKETEDLDHGAKIFYYVFDTDSQLAASEEPSYVIRDGVLRLIHNWDAADGEVKLKKFRLPNGDRAVVMLCSMKIYNGSQVLGTVFVGEDISSYYQMLKMLLIMMVILSLVFLIIAAFAGHLLAGTAMIPIKQAFSRQREFVADASHELRTPLSVLQLSAEAVQNDNDQKLSPFSTQVLDDMNSEIRRMTRLINDLLTLARADAGATNIIKEKFDLVAMAKPLVRSIQPLAVVKRLKLAMSGDETLPITADRERISQLLLILIDNAIKYTPAGGKVDVLLTRTATPKPSVTIAVSDTGEGISEKERKLIFERFYRIDKARSREEGGTGLGLSIAKWIVDVHGGKIKVESTPGKGSSFIVILPQ
ncbi:MULTISPECIES: sensor histidine kinase [Pelosinus]|uniref:histidine kinase n=1 Tax=Pelosinus fermentans B4 TaxID=1149862 RepID=I9B3P0_9FIRM|nr:MULTISPECIES: ATP-binding protein [Pelosinus]EIW19762.1 ATP-binding region ATPase domain protein [Pelosinus fermentans B4]EIW21381.1 integral membrane sensor signal transduction histidine kinase [Pelosinus fermentans A11]OAM94915.1 integral membrane sensor signal transduction histidine kinase [Pelosinus fermentans DSM 17108]SDR20275.1 His Kinase A (phospho-acceptor) domain-containing protein [Pelosinus fermentans]